MSSVTSIFKAIILKDLRREFRSKEIFLSSFMFSLIMLVLIYFAVTSGDLDHSKMAAGSLWLCIFFSGTIGLNRIHQSETVNGCYRALILAPIDGGWIYLAKVVANLLLIGVMTLLLLPLIGLMFEGQLMRQPLLLFASLSLGITAFVAVGTLVVAITANTRMKDVLFPIVQLPLVVPTMIAGVNSTANAFAGAQANNWLQLLGAVNLVLLPTGFLLYEFLLEE